ncbi:hypothetical protein ACWCXC_17150 [Streptomyces sp. NPDC001515]
MIPNPCSICHQHAPADCYLCDACTYRVRSWLAGLPQQAALLRLCLAPAVGPAQRGGSGRAHSPVPVDLRVLDLLGPGSPVPLADPHGDQTAGVPITALLAGWAHYIATDVPVVRVGPDGVVRTGGDLRAVAVPRSGTGITAWSTWLIRYLPYAVTRPYAVDLHEQLQHLADRIQRITHTRPRRRHKDAPCPGCSAFALVEQDTELLITCEACGQVLTPAGYDQHRAQVMPALAAIALRIAARQAAA